MAVLKTQTLPVKTESDIVHVRQTVRAWSIEIKCSLVDQTKIVTAASELARNLLIYGGGGEVRLTILQEGIRRGLRVVFEDHGPGIPDIALAMKDGYTSGHGMGLGLGGGKALGQRLRDRVQTGRGHTNYDHPLEVNVSNQFHAPIPPHPGDRQEPGG